MACLHRIWKMQHPRNLLQHRRWKQRAKVFPGARNGSEQAGSFRQVQDDIMKSWKWFNIIFLDLIQFEEPSEHSKLPVRVVINCRTNSQDSFASVSCKVDCFDHLTFYQCSEQKNLVRLEVKTLKSRTNGCTCHTVVDLGTAVVACTVRLWLCKRSQLFESRQTYIIFALIYILSYSSILAWCYS